MARKPKPLQINTELRDLILECIPVKTGQAATVTMAAQKLKLSRWSIYKWLVKGILPPARAKELAGLSKGRVPLERFDRFVYDI